MEHEKRSEFEGVKLSNPYKVLYAEGEITKADIASYYERVSSRMLPLVRN